MAASFAPRPVPAGAVLILALGLHAQSGGLSPQRRERRSSQGSVRRQRVLAIPPRVTSPQAPSMEWTRGAELPGFLGKLNRGADGAPTLELAPDNDTAVMASDETMDSAFNSAKPEPVTSSSRAGLPRKGGRHSDGKRG